MYLKDSPDYINPKYIWVHGSNSLGSGVSAEILFCDILAFTGKEGGVARWDRKYDKHACILCSLFL